VSNFNISPREQLHNPGKVFEEMTKYAPDGLRTSRSERHVNPFNLTMFNLSEILMRVPVYDDPAKVIERFENLVSGTMGSFWDPDNIPGVAHLLPGDLLDGLNAANPDGMGEEPDSGSAGTGGGGGSSPVGGPAGKVISIARGYLGTHENPRGSNRTIFHTKVGHRQGALWCGIFLMAVFKEAGMNEPALSAATWVSRQRFMADNRWGRNPKVGAIAHFSFGRTNNPTDHVALVERYDDSHIYTIDGNTSRPGGGSQSNGGHVWEKKRARNGQVVGYGYPNYD